jgi:hypothetical protein
LQLKILLYFYLGIWLYGTVHARNQKPVLMETVSAGIFEDYEPLILSDTSDLVTWGRGDWIRGTRFSDMRKSPWKCPFDHELKCGKSGGRAE